METEGYLSSLPGREKALTTPAPSLTDMSDVMGLAGAPGSFLTSIDLNKEENKYLAIQAMQGDVSPGADYVNREIEVRDVLFHGAKKIDAETGEMRQWIRTVLFLVDGTVISFGSEGVAKSIVTFCKFFGPPPWPKGRKFAVQRRKLADAMQWYYLNPLPGTPGK